MAKTVFLVKTVVQFPSSHYAHRRVLFFLTSLTGSSCPFLQVEGRRGAEDTHGKKTAGFSRTNTAEQ